MDKICRLCANVKSPKQLVCTIDDQTLNIKEKLIDCCRWKQFQSAENYNLPQNICNICLKNLEKCWSFAESVAQAQQMLIAQSVEVKPTILLQIESVNTVDLHESSHDIIEDIKITFNPPEPLTHYEQSFVESMPELFSNDNITEESNDRLTKEQLPHPKDEYNENRQIDVNVSVNKKIDVDLLNALSNDAKNSDGTIRMEYIMKLDLFDWSMIKTRCSICKQIFENYRQLKCHFDANHPHQTLRLLCMFCNSTLGKKRSVFRHVINSHRPYLKYWLVLDNKQMRLMYILDHLLNVIHFLFTVVENAINFTGTQQHSGNIVPDQTDVTTKKPKSDSNCYVKYVVKISQVNRN